MTLLITLEQMNKTLPSDFTIERYGIQVRLVNESDAEFIVELRTDNKRAAYISSTNSDVQNQIDWIREYKERESVGEEFYFHITCEGKAAGVIRLYHIHDKEFEVGSIVMMLGTSAACVLATTIIAKEVAFEMLELEIEKSEVYVNNKQVVKFQKSWGKTLVGTRLDEVGENLIFRLTKEDYLKVKPKKIRQLESLMA